MKVAESFYEKVLHFSLLSHFLAAAWLRLNPLTRGRRASCDTEFLMSEKQSDKTPVPELIGISHPEEMKSVVDLRIGNAVSLQAAARITPAGVVCVGIALSLAVLAFSALARARRAGPL